MYMQGSKTNRRAFLATSLTAATSALTIGICNAEGEAQGDAAQSLPPTLSFLSPNGLYDTSVLATSLKGEAADRLALRRLVDSWAHCADRRLAEQQSSLFTPDGVLLNYEGDPATHKPVSTLSGRMAIETALAVLNTFTVTLHMNGQSEVAIHGGRAIGETYCIVHQFKTVNGQRNCQTLGIRYYDQFLREESRWFFAERKLIIDWSDTRVSTP
jgi:SnoaL-like protein